MKTNTIILILLGVTMTCQAQSTNPPASQKPAQSRAGFAAGPEDALISGAPSSPASDPFATKGAASGDVRILRRQDGSTFVENVNKGKQPATDPTLGAGNGNVRILSRDAAVELARDLAKKGRYAEARALLNDEMSDGAMAKFSKDGHVSGGFVTRIYRLEGLITKAPAEIDDDAHNKQANDAYATKIEVLNGLWKTVLEHSEPAGAAFSYSSDAGLFVVKATEAQHELLQEAAQLLEKNERK